MIELKTCMAIGKPLKYVSAAEKHKYECRSCKNCPYKIMGTWESERQAREIGKRPLRNFFSGKKIRCR
ncbi:MAG: hypothetical protein HFI70_11130 [Lachnospiraceae bacterium]|nr:hypothetical protein [Lachnospiraceae bacterium]